MCRIAGSVSSAATCPLDVAKTRLQSSLIAAGHLQSPPTLSVAGGGFTAALHTSMPQSRYGRPTVSIGFYHCIRWSDRNLILTSAKFTDSALHLWKLSNCEKTFKNSQRKGTFEISVKCCICKFQRIYYICGLCYATADATASSFSFAGPILCSHSKSSLVPQNDNVVTRCHSCHPAIVNKVLKD